VTATSATIAWPAGPGGVKYELHRQNGTTSEQWGETTGTSFTVSNLVPGTRYTANVIARDGAGRVSWASPPVTFQTGTPSTSECAVTFTNATDWGNGYVASVDITNTSANPVDSWTLSFTWPTGWQQMSGGWNGNWSETGSNGAGQQRRLEPHDRSRRVRQRRLRRLVPGPERAAAGLHPQREVVHDQVANGSEWRAAADGTVM
jgi:hypothetical protein